MERHLKERIVGATVIVALGIIIIPWLLDGPAQSSRPVEQAIELPPVEQPGRTYTIPLDPAAGPAVPVESVESVEAGNGQPAQSRPAAGAIQRPSEASPIAPATEPEPQVTRPAEQPAQPPPRPAPQPAPAAQPTPPAPVAEAWTVQVGSFSQADNAQSLQARLKAEGFEAFVSRVATDAGTMHRVRVGPVPERADAERLLTRLRAAGHSGARVVRAQD